jgi:hypothetical protein
MTTTALSPNGTAGDTNPASAQKRKFAALDAETLNTITSDHTSASPTLYSNGESAHSSEFYDNLLVILKRYFEPFQPSIAISMQEISNL